MVGTDWDLGGTATSHEAFSMKHVHILLCHSFSSQQVKEEWLNVAVFLTFFVAPIQYANWYKEQEKLHHRF